MVQVVTTKSWGSRFMGALMGILIGLALIVGSFLLVFWNEGNGLRTAQSLAEAEKILISVPSAPINAQNNLKVVYFSDKAVTNDTLKDALLGVSQNAIKLDRKVEMYQWEENKETTTEDQVGGSQKETTNYTYKTTWSTNLIDSSGFQEQSGHQNPANMPIKSKSEIAESVTVGDFHLPSALIKEISDETAVDLSRINTEKLKSKVHKPITVEGDSLYAGDDPQNPKIGDLKISLTEVLPQTVSIIAQQIDNTVQPYMAPSGESVSILAMGKQSSQQMFSDARFSNKIMTWGLRACSLLMMILGIGLMMSPLVVLADVLPFLGAIVGFGTWLVAFIVGISLWSVAFAVAWFTVRPLLSLAVISIAVVIAGCIVYYRRK